jgi:hypothetical protein
MSLETERNAAHKIVREAMEKAGVIDGFYGGILITGKDISAFHVGIPDRQCYENIERYQRVVGLMESLKYGLLKETHDKEENGFEE